ncbi:MAG: lamin tail domain-containing protein, partial [Bacteroidota bacterium]
PQQVESNSWDQQHLVFLSAVVNVPTCPLPCVLSAPLIGASCKMDSIEVAIALDAVNSSGQYHVLNAATGDTLLRSTFLPNTFAVLATGGGQLLEVLVQDANVANCTLTTALLLPTCPVPTCSNILISEYTESANDKCVELYNPTPDTIHLASDNYDVKIYANGSNTPSVTTPLTGIIPPGDTYILCTSSSSVAYDQVLSLAFNGNDAIAICQNNILLDAFGVIGQNPGPAGWNIGTNFTSDIAAKRNTDILQGDTNPYTIFDAAAWTVCTDTIPEDFCTISEVRTEVICQNDGTYDLAITFTHHNPTSMPLVDINIQEAGVTIGTMNAVTTTGNAQMVTFTSLPSDGGTNISVLVSDTNAPTGMYISAVDNIPSEDTNGDGSIDECDEYVEITNGSCTVVDLTNWEIWDRAGRRHIFAVGTMISAGETIRLYNNDLSTINSCGQGVWNNTSDDILLYSDAGITQVDAATYSNANGEEVIFTGACYAKVSYNEPNCPVGQACATDEEACSQMTDLLLGEIELICNTDGTLTLNLAYSNSNADVSVNIVSGGRSIPNIGDDPSLMNNGTLTALVNAGDSYMLAFNYGIIPNNTSTAATSSITFTGFAPNCVIVPDTQNFGEHQSDCITCDLSLNNVAVTNEFCANANDGTITIDASSSRDFALNYSVDGGATFQTMNTFSSLAPGTYTLVVQHSVLTNCTLTTEVTIQAGASVALDNNIIATNESCPNANDATIELSANFSAGVLEYSIDGGATFQPTPIFTNLAAGNYDVLVQPTGIAACAISGGMLNIMAGIDDELPSFNCLTDTILNTTLGACSAVLNNIDLGVVTDNCDPSPNITYTLSGATLGSGIDDASGTAFQLGTTLVTYTITDVNGNT